jgi:hypothetical protein
MIRPPQAGQGAVLLASAVIRQALVPMAAGYLLVMGALAAGLSLWWRHRDDPGWLARPPLAGRQRTGRRRQQRAGAGAGALPAAAPAPGARRGWPALLRRVAGTVAGGYLLLLAVVFGYYFGVAEVGGDFLLSAISGSALLIGLAMPVALAFSWITQRRHTRQRAARDRPPDQG